VEIKHNTEVLQYVAAVLPEVQLTETPLPEALLSSMINTFQDRPVLYSAAEDMGAVGFAVGALAQRALAGLSALLPCPGRPLH